MSLASFVTEHKHSKLPEPSTFCRKAYGKSPPLNPSAAAWETIRSNSRYLPAAGSQPRRALSALPFTDQ